MKVLCDPTYYNRILYALHRVCLSVCLTFRVRPSCETVSIALVHWLIFYTLYTLLHNSIFGNCLTKSMKYQDMSVIHASAVLLKINKHNARNCNL